MSDKNAVIDDDFDIRVGPSGGGAISWDEHMETVRENNGLHDRVHELETEITTLRSQIEEYEYGQHLVLPHERLVLPKDLERLLPKETVEVFIDGNGVGGHAALFPDKQFVEYLPKGATHNEAEWAALELALKFMESDQAYLVKADSNLVVQQVNKSWRIKEPRLRQFADRCWSLMRHLNVKVMWIPRNQNLADALLR